MPSTCVSRPPASWPMWMWSVGIVVVTGAILIAMGRPLVSPSGTIAIWHGSINTAEDSQQITDWYSLTHLVHGILFYWILWLCSKKVRWLARPARRFVVAIAMESAWEILENTPIIINRYREATIALGYHGDSVINSMSDVVCMAIGFLGAMRLPVWATVAIAIGLELLALLVIRDNLTLNVLMLLFPIDSVAAWQSGS